METLPDLNKELQELDTHKHSNNRLTLWGFICMLVGFGACGLGMDSNILLGLVILTFGLILFIVSVIRGLVLKRKVYSIQKQLSATNPSQSSPVKLTAKTVIVNIILTILILAVIGVGGCFTVFGWALVGGNF